MKKVKPSNTNDFGVNNHIVICNWSDKTDLLIKQLHDPSIEERFPIIIVTEHPEEIPDFDEDDSYRGIMIVKGNSTHEETLLRAGVDTAKTVIVLADRSLGESADTKTIMTAIAIDHIVPDVHVVAEVLLSSNVPYFSYTFVNEIICLELLTERLLAQSCLTPGVSFIFKDLLTQSSDTNEIYVESIPDKYIGKTYQELRSVICNTEDIDMILIGLSTFTERVSSTGEPILNYSGKVVMEKALVINPKIPDNKKDEKFSREYILQKEDKIFVISYSRPNLNEIL
ncbi:MAG: hypothetical protein CL438_05960 [Acidimicrobiaceae bacterium]|nr:hypothetical protein [Acidimicrobiaceae bacterium]